MAGVLWVLLGWSLLVIVSSPMRGERDPWMFPLATQFLVPCVGFLYLGSVLRDGSQAVQEGASEREEVASRTARR